MSLYYFLTFSIEVTCMSTPYFTLPAVFLEKEIKKIAKAFELIVCEAEEIDKKSSDGTKLTELEAEKIAQIITKLTPEEEKLKVIIDCPSFGIGNWKNVLRIKLKNLGNIELVVEHKADKNHLSVGAASILAKCERERKMTELKEKYGDEIGSGYCMDPLTKRFVEKFAIKFKDDGLFRKSWSTWKIAYTKLKQIELEF